VNRNAQVLLSASVLAWTAACGTGQPAAAPEGAAPESADSSAGDAPQPQGTTSSETGGGEPGAADGATNSAQGEDPVALAGRLCNVLCEEIKGACTPRSAQFCQASCPGWTEAAKACPIEVEEALTCQTGADRFLLCSNVATATCAPLYRTLSECRDGKRPPKTEKGPPPPSGVPAGYVRHTLPALGGYFLLPEGPLDEASETRVVANRPPHAYVIERLSNVPQKPLSDMTVLQIASAYVGNACVPKLSLKGRFEKGNLTYVRFATTCKDGSAWAGLFLLEPGQGVAASVKVPAGKALPADLDTYIYGFEPTVAPPARNNDVEE